MPPKKDKPRYEKVFRAKAQGKTMPKIGMPTSVQPGDWLDFWLDGGARHGRYVASMHEDHCITEPLTGPYGTLDGPRKVIFTEFCSATRRVDPPADEVAPEPTPEPEPAPEPKGTEPEPPEKQVKPPKKKPPPHFLDFLDDRYKD